MPSSQAALPMTGNNESGTLTQTWSIQARCHALLSLWFIRAKPGLSLHRCVGESIPAWVQVGLSELEAPEVSENRLMLEPSLVAQLVEHCYGTPRLQGRFHSQGTY